MQLSPVSCNSMSRKIISTGDVPSSKLTSNRALPRPACGHASSLVEENVCTTCANVILQDWLHGAVIIVVPLTIQGITAVGWEESGSKLTRDWRMEGILTGGTELHFVSKAVCYIVWNAASQNSSNVLLGILQQISVFKLRTESNYMYLLHIGARLQRVRTSGSREIFYHLVRPG